MSPRYPSTDPRLIRQVLEYAETHSKNATATHFGIHHHNVQRWRNYRSEHGPAWPTDDDVAAWDAGAERRAKVRRWKHHYEQRRYLNGGQFLIVSETGTIRRLQALCAIGWTQGEIGARLGVTRSRVSNIIRRNARYGVTRATARRVAAVYDELSMTVRVGREATRMRRFAVSKGWAPPLAWDDDTIDDPKARPVGLHDHHRAKKGLDESAIERRMAGDRTAKTRGPENFEVVRRLLAEGRSQRWISIHTGLKAERYISREQVAA